MTLKHTLFLAASAALLVLLVAATRSHTQVIEKFSFDTDEMVYPRGYWAHGVAISLLNRVKLLPRIPNVAGQFFTQEVSSLFKGLRAKLMILPASR